jgi:ADP-heptose:LPS heptosyltransferase
MAIWPVPVFLHHMPYSDHPVCASSRSTTFIERCWTSSGEAGEHGVTSWVGTILVVKLECHRDIIHTLPAVAALRRAFPEAWLAWLVERAGANLLRGNPDLDELITVDTRGWRANWWVGLRHVWYVTRHLRRASFDLCIDFQGLFKSALFAYCSGAPRRLGFPRQMCREPLSAVFTNVHGPLVDPRVHVVDQLWSC